jgi:hypothetical protein
VWDQMWDVACGMGFGRLGLWDNGQPSLLGEEARYLGVGGVLSEHYYLSEF